MKNKMLVICSVCSSVALLHLIIGGSFILGGCTGVQEDEPMPKGAYIPPQTTTTEEAPEVSEPATKEPAVTAPETAAPVVEEPKTQPPVVAPPAEKTEPVPQKKVEPPVKGGTSSAAPLKGERLQDVEYTVKKGDSYWKIAKMYGISTSELVAYNKIPPEKLAPGKKIMIPATGKKGSSAAAAPAKQVVKVKKAYEPIPADGIYVVKKGDSFYRIAQKFGIPAKEIAEYNNIPLTKSLQVNQKLKLPAKKAAAAPAAVAKQTSEAAKPAAAPADAAPAVPSANAGSLDEIAPPSLDDVPAVPAAAPAASAPAVPAASTNEAITQEVISIDTTVADLAKAYGFTEAEIRAKNPGIPADGTVKRGTTIIMP